VWSQEHIKRAVAPKWCKIGPKLLLRTNKKSTPRFRLAPNLSTLDDLEWLKCPLVEVNKNSGARQNNFNEDRQISLLGKYRPLHLFAINIKCMQICIAIPSEKVYLPPTPASIIPDCTCFHCITYFTAHRQTGTWLAQRPWRVPPAPPS